MHDSGSDADLTKGRRVRLLDAANDVCHRSERKSSWAKKTAAKRDSREIAFGSGAESERVALNLNGAVDRTAAFLPSNQIFAGKLRVRGHFALTLVQTLM
ncbi:hypothetical protein NXC12_CH01346 [Rhizobium etli]|uniref:Uncharacterized protein n=1 Tax=Rhizobium etli TaxID=29449 RepID=A0AAN1EJ36_RHIET|nr:hypothetical protein REMIM1_CH01304 [Rhizobium etli bv. mimosae str. Mim1]ARQ09415.1 hypothetical protein NXC12_CH01346 [Rhizobium etli]